MIAPERIWPVGGYAPGTYWCHCSQCNGSFQGDKRAFECPDCVIQRLRATPEALADSPEVQALVMRAVLDGQIRAFERGRLDTPDELRAIRAGTEGGE